MTDLRKVLDADLSRTYATDAGTEMHQRLQRVSLNGNPTGDADLIEHIRACPGLADFFGANSKSEVPVVGKKNNTIISRRIDRLVVDDTTHTVRILDYKTDIDRTERRQKYIAQLCEYKNLMREVFPDYQIETYILWTHYWELEQIDTTKAYGALFS